MKDWAANRIAEPSNGFAARLQSEHSRSCLRQFLRLASGAFSAVCLVQLAYGTLPWPPEIFTSPSSNYTASLQSDSSEALVICSSNKVLCRFAYKDLGISERSTMDLMSTAGLRWCRDCIAFFDTLERHFIIRLHWGRFVVVDLQTRTASLELPSEIKREVDETVRKRVLAWLTSSEPRERANGARYAGDLRLRAAIPKLKELTSDPTSGNSKKGDAPVVKSYWIRKAAVAALKKMNIAEENVVLEEPNE